MEARALTRRKMVVTLLFGVCFAGMIWITESPQSEARVRENNQAVPKTITTSDGVWKLVWDDEFQGPRGSAPNPAKWTYDMRNNHGWGNNEEEYYTSSVKNAFLTGHGGLAIQAIKKAVDGYSYTSARLVSKRSWRYGYFEVDAKLPRGGQGVWPAIWMLPTNWTYGGWPESGEIDIMEAINQMNQVHGDLHYGTGSEPDLGTWYPNTISPGFHVYAVKWTPDRMLFFVDGHAYLTFTADQWTTSVGPMPAPFDQPFHLMINMAMGGNWPGPIGSSTRFPQQMIIRWVRVYQPTPAYAWPVPGIIQADKAFTHSPDIRIAKTHDLSYDPTVTPTAPSNLALVLDHKLILIHSNDSVTYKVHVATKGLYNMALRVKSNKGSVRVSIDGKPTLVIKLRGSADTWSTATTHVQLPAGIHQVTLTSETSTLQMHWLQWLPG